MKTTSSILLTLLLTAGCGGQEADSPTGAAADQEPQVETPPPTAAAQTPRPGDELAAIHIEGMVCESCADAARSCLEGVEGVHSVSVSVEEKRARVGYDPNAVTPQILLAALQGVDRGEAPPFEVSLLEDDGVASGAPAP